METHYTTASAAAHWIDVHQRCPHRFGRRHSRGWRFLTTTNADDGSGWATSRHSWRSAQFRCRRPINPVRTSCYMAEHTRIRNGYCFLFLWKCKEICAPEIRMKWAGFGHLRGRRWVTGTVAAFVGVRYVDIKTSHSRHHPLSLCIHCWTRSWCLFDLQTHKYIIVLFSLLVCFEHFLVVQRWLLWLVWFCMR